MHSKEWGTVSFRVVTANVNGIRATSRRGGLQWLAESGADVICLQEVRATTEQLMSVLDSSVLSHWHTQHAPAPELGRSGVAVLSREAPSAVRINVKVPDIDGQGRWIECDFDSGVGPVTVVSTYIHSGEVDTPKQVAKSAFLTGVDKRLATLARLAKRNGREALVCGDFNIGHREVDIKNWKANQKNSGCLPCERQWLDEVFGKLNLVDAFRHLNANSHEYTWWSNRGQAWANNVGWRLDYMLATPGLSGKGLRQPIYRDERFSDHAPLTIDFNLSLEQ